MKKYFEQGKSQPGCNFCSVDIVWTYNNNFFTLLLVYHTLREKCPNTELFLVLIFLYSDWIRRFTPKISVVSPKIGKHRPEITPYLDTFHAVTLFLISDKEHHKFFQCTRRSTCFTWFFFKKLISNKIILTSSSRQDIFLTL